MANPASNLRSRAEAQEAYKKKLESKVKELQAREAELLARTQNSSDDPEDLARANKELVMVHTELANTEARLQNANFQAQRMVAAASKVGSVARTTGKVVKAPFSFAGRTAKAVHGGATWVVQSVFGLYMFAFLVVLQMVLEWFVFEFGAGVGNRLDRTVVAFYLFMALVGTFMYGFDRYLFKRFFLFLVLAALYVVGIPWILELTRNTFVHDPINAAVVWIPLWLFVLWKASPADSWLHSLSGVVVKLLTVVTVVFVIFLLVNNLSGEDARFKSDFEFKRGFDYVWEPIKTAFGFVFGGLFSLPGTIIDGITGTYESAYYIGQVEENREAPLGVYIENFRALDNELSSGFPIYLAADLRALSFEGSIELNSSCSAVSQSNEALVFQGVTNPSEFFIEGLSLDTVDCRFDKLWADSYTVTLDTNFNFGTWGYIEYTFMDSSLARSYSRQGKDVNAELGIPFRGEAVYTNGPVMIGIRDLPLPLKVETSRVSDWSMPLGITVENRWFGGEVKRVRSYVVQVPNELVIEDGSCNRPGALLEGPLLPENYIEGYTPYRFANDLSLSSRWDTLQCRLIFAGSTVQERTDNMNSLLGSNPKSLRTFAVQVDYDYLLSEELEIVVEGTVNPSLGLEPGVPFSVSDDDYPGSVSVYDYTGNFKLDSLLKSDSRSSSRSVVPTFVVLHHTGGASAVSSLNSWSERVASTHYMVDRAGKIISIVPESRTAWHAGACDGGKCIITGMNTKSIGIEIANCGKGTLDSGCGKTGEWGIDPYPEAQVEAVDKLVSYLVSKYEIDGFTNVLGDGCVRSSRDFREPTGFSPSSFDTWQLLRRGESVLCGGAT